jgi:hypothetical protein
MLTSSECYVVASHTQSLAEHEPQRRTRLFTAAEGWLILGNELRELEARARTRRCSVASARSEPRSQGPHQMEKSESEACAESAPTVGALGHASLSYTLLI